VSDIRLSFPSQVLNVNELWDESKEKSAIMLASIAKEEPEEE